MVDNGGKLISPNANPVQFAEEFKKKIDACAFEEDNTPETTQLKALELAWCASDFKRFLHWVKVINPPVPGSTGDSTIPFILYPHIEEMIGTLSDSLKITILKARQIGLSTLIAAYILWYAMFHKGAKILVFSAGQQEAKELLSKCHAMHDQLPSFFRLVINPDSTEVMGFPSMGSTIKAFPSTESAGVGETASIVICDEHALHPYASANFTTAKPTIDRGAQYISIFTAHPTDNDNLASTIFLDGLSGKNGFKAVFFPYTVMPGRDKAWYERVMRETPERDREGLTPELYMRRNYPASVDEAFTVPQTSAAFEKAALDHMMTEAVSVSRVIVEHEGIDYKYVNIYRPFQLGQYYVASSDISEGVGNDYNVTCIMNAKTGIIVADILDNNLKIEPFAYQTYLLLQLYKNPKYWPEYNLLGHQLVPMMLNLRYPNLGYRDTNGEKKKPGWVTDEKSRVELFSGGINSHGREFLGLISAVNNNQITIYNADGIQQFRDVIRNANPGKKGRIEAKSGGHDDYPIAAGICWIKAMEVQPDEVVVIPAAVRYQETMPWKRS